MSEQEQIGDSRRTFMKKGALATSALAFGSAASTASVGAQDDGQMLVFSYDYHPGQDFTVIASLQAGTVVDVLQVDDETVSEISQPDDYDGWVIRYDSGGDNAGETTFLFSREASFSSGDTDALGEDASMFSPQLNLLSVSPNGGGTADTDTDEESIAENESADGNETNESEGE